MVQKPREPWKPGKPPAKPGPPKPGPTKPGTPPKK